MCGIVCIINMDGKDTNQAEDLHRMTEVMKHRGPNGVGYWLLSSLGQHSYGGDETPFNIPMIDSAFEHKSHIAFGHRRLSIIDLSVKGHQPMSYADRYSIIFNGEIYNYLELKSELTTMGYKFATDTDAEVIMASYDHWGHDCLNKFNGMWSFVCYDNQKNNYLFHEIVLGLSRFIIIKMGKL